MKLNTIDEAAKALKKGEVIVVIDDENRENEGDLICAAEYATTENINFMATNGKGLICQPVSYEIAKKLNLQQMVSENTDNHETAFTVTIDHVDTTTGISAEERGYTARSLINLETKPEDLRRPGHVFPLLAKENGVLEREGHTEAAIDLMRISKLNESAVICEIMREDGTMMRTNELIKFAKKWDLKIISIEDLKEYRKLNDVNIEHVSTVKMPMQYGEFKLYSYVNKINREHHLALVKGDISKEKNPLVRLHSECLTGDVLGSLRCDCGDQLHLALEKISQNGSGVLLYLRQEGRGIGLVNKLRAYELQDQGLDTLEANHALGFKGDLRKYDIAAQILRDLKINDIELMTNNPDKVSQLEEFGINIFNRQAIKIKPNKYDYDYLKTKKERMGHLYSL